MNFTNNEHFSIILPTFREAKNIPELVKRISHVDFGERKYEVIIVDDNSQDGTDHIVKTLQAQYPWLKLIVRQTKKGLSESVLEGLARAHYATWVVMDADLSHPPEKIPALLEALAQPRVDFVIGSRYVAGGSSDESWPLMRKLCSRLAASLARAVVTVPIQDPLSGFWALKKETFTNGHPLRPIGWKIGLEIIVKCGCLHIYEVPIHFSQRGHGTSKLNLHIVVNFLRHITHLMWFKKNNRTPS